MYKLRKSMANLDVSDANSRDRQVEMKSKFCAYFFASILISKYLQIKLQTN